MRKILLAILLLLVLGIAWAAWNVFGATIKPPPDKFYYIQTGSTYDQVVTDLKAKNIIPSKFFFDQLASQAKYPENVKPGKYEIKKGMSLYGLVRMLKSGAQTPVKLVINKLRTKEDFAGKLGKLFEIDSLEVINFISNNDSLLKYNVDSNTVMAVIIPNTYLIYWNTSFRKIFNRLKDEQEKFWNKERIAKAREKNLTPLQVYTMASIVEEETNKKKDKSLIASVYINRLKKGMKLEADPTVKYAMRDFGLKRIMYNHLLYPSPFNTYRNTGLPPGPISTPSIETIDAVLDAPETSYIFFVAKPSFDGYSNFAETYEQHLKYAREYQDSLNELIRRKQMQNNY